MEGTAALDADEVVIVRDLVHVTGRVLPARRMTITAGRYISEEPAR